MQLDLGRFVKKIFAKQAYLPYVGPISLWLIVLVFAPLGLILYFSFLTTEAYGGRIIPSFTLENYVALARAGYARIMLRTFRLAFGNAMLCLLVGYPLAYWITRCRSRWKLVFVFLVVVPSWICFVIRVYALQTLLMTEGFINSALLSLGLISSPIQILFTQFAVVLGLAYRWLPLMVLPIYASLDGLDPALLEASEDLGATPIKRFFTVTLPLTKGGIFAGVILVLIPSLGEWLLPEWLGGGKVMMGGNLVIHHFLVVGSIPKGSAIAVVLTVAAILILAVFIKLAGSEALERVV